MGIRFDRSSKQLESTIKPQDARTRLRDGF
jgi:hypothetical protein